LVRDSAKYEAREDSKYPFGLHNIEEMAREISPLFWKDRIERLEKSGWFAHKQGEQDATVGNIAAATLEKMSIHTEMETEAEGNNQ